MRAYQVLMFMLCFNLAVFITQSMGIYEMALTPIWVNSTSLTVITMAAVFGSLLGGAVVSLFTRNATAMQYSMYIFFSGAFFGLYLATLSVFDSIINVILPSLGVTQYLLYTAVTAIIVVIFVIGLVQMVTGGWKGLY
jgi:hypothetical protein